MWNLQYIRLEITEKEIGNLYRLLRISFIRYTTDPRCAETKSNMKYKLVDIPKDDNSNTIDFFRSKIKEDKNKRSFRKTPPIDLKE